MRNISYQDMARSSCVYSIENRPDKIAYVGRTKTVAYMRWLAHRSELLRGVHYNPVLQAAWTTWGEEEFEFRILEHSLPKENLGPQERYWIRWYLEKGWKVYNQYRGRQAQGVKNGRIVTYREKLTLKGCRARLAITWHKLPVILVCIRTEQHSNKHRAFTGESPEGVRAYTYW